MNISPLRIACVLVLAFVVLTGQRSSAQIAPAGLTVIQSPPGVYYVMFADSVQPRRAVFYYLNYTTQQLDIISPSLSASGFFSGVSSSTGRMLTGQILGTSMSVTYNSVTKSGPKESLYGPTGRFAGIWRGFVTDPNLGTGFAELFISSQGECLALAYLGFSYNAGIGTIDSGGNTFIPLLSGLSISGTFSPANGGASGSFSFSNGATNTYGLSKAVTSRLANISTRGVVASGEQVLIAGFIITDGGKTVLITARGKSLSGITNPIQNPRLDLYRNGQVIASNTNWQNNSNAAEIAASGLAPTDLQESALQVNLEPGAYTAIVSSEDATSGIGLVEVYGVGSPVGF